jgi:uncharacterized repeat protein (TIGR04076 family)
MNTSEENKSIIVRHLGHETCKYHREKEGRSFDFEHLGPKGLCLDLYHSAYPYFLALLYGAKFSWMDDKDTVNAQCPASNGNVHFEVRRKPLKQEIISEGVKKNCEIWLRITHIESDCDDNCKGLCPQKIGQEFEFNQGDLLDHLCPAAFSNIWPTLKVILCGGNSEWKKEGKICVQCPDNKSKLRFEISKR